MCVKRSPAWPPTSDDPSGESTGDVRSEAELETLIAFFRARRGPAQAFRFRDPFDHSSNAMTGEPGAAERTSPRR